MIGFSRHDLAMVEPTDRRAGRLFTPATHTKDGPSQKVLPGFGFERERSSPALPLVLYDLGGGSSMTPGRGRTPWPSDCLSSLSWWLG